MENTIDFKKNSPRSGGDDDKHSDQIPKITPASEGKGKGKGKGKGPLAAVAAADDKKEAPPADVTVPAAERAEKGNAGGGQKGRKRAREAAAGEGSGEWDNQGGGGAGGDQLPLDEPMKLTTCPWEGCDRVFDNKRALFHHLSLHIRRPWLKGAFSSSLPAAVTGGAATDEATKTGQAAEIDLNVKQFLVPDLNLQPPEYVVQEEED